MRIDDRIDSVGRRPFRARFHVRGRERAFVQLRGIGAVRGHAATCCRTCLERWHELEGAG